MESVSLSGVGTASVSSGKKPCKAAIVCCHWEVLSLSGVLQQVQAAGRNLVKGQQHPTTRSHPYQSLLQQYLSAFLPRGGQHSLTHASSRAQLKSLGQFSKGDLLFSVLMEFWLTDGEDPALRNPKQDRPLPALPYEPPTDDLLEAMQVSPALG